MSIRKITRPVCFVKQNKLLTSSVISSVRHKQRISWTVLNDAMAISAKEMPKNHTDKERFAAASSCIQTGILTLLFPRKRRRSSPSPFISHRVLEAVASWILKSLLSTSAAYTHGQIVDAELANQSAHFALVML